MSRQAIIEYDGRQFSCVEGAVITVNRIPQQVGETVQIGRVIAYLDEKAGIITGKQLKQQSKAAAGGVTAMVEAQERLPKVVSRKYRRRKSSRSQYAHRQPVTRLKITAIKPAA